MSMKKYNIVLPTDQNYIQHLGVTLMSLLKNNSDIDFNIYIVNNGIESTKWKKLEQISNGYKCKLIDIKISDQEFDYLPIYKKATDNMKAIDGTCNLKFNNTKGIYYRLLIPNFIQGDKVLYLDSDIIIRGSIKEFYQENIDDYFIGAVENPGFNWHSNLNMNLDSKYFNAGVLLINLPKWREYNLHNKVLKFLELNQAKIRHADQCGLNAIINGNWKRLPPKFNQQTVMFSKNFENNQSYFTSNELKEAKENPIIIHYTEDSKPWHFFNNRPYKKQYWKYLKMTQFYPYIPKDLTIKNLLKFLIKKIEKGTKRILRLLRLSNVVKKLYLKSLHYINNRNK